MGTAHHPKPKHPEPLKFCENHSHSGVFGFDTALRLARYFGMSPRVWLGLQMAYDLDVAEDEIGDRLSQEVVALESQTQASGFTHHTVGAQPLRPSNQSQDSGSQHTQRDLAYSRILSLSKLRPTRWRLP
jgi:hypothetical protein